MRLALALFLLFVAFSPGRLVSFDVSTRAAVSRALWSEGTVFVPQGHPVESGLVFPKGSPRGTTFYGMGQSLLLIPFDWLGAQLGKITPSAEQLPIALLYTPLVGVAWWWALALLLETLGMARRRATQGAALFAVTTIFFVYASQTAQEEALVGTLLTLSLAFWLRALRGERLRFAGGAGFLAGYALLVRLNVALAFLPLLGALFDAPLAWRERLRAIAWAVLGAATPLLALMVFAAWRFGSPLATGYDLAAAQGMGVFFTRFQWNVFWGVLLGFGKGLFVLSPPLALAALGWRAAWRGHRGLGWGIAASLLASATLCGFIFNNPDGSECWGARYQVHLIGFLAYPMLLGWQRLYESWRVLAWSLAGIGFAVQILASLGPDAIEYVQSDRAGAPRTELITGVTTGQLGRRLGNAAQWLVGTSSREPALVDEMTRVYVPNVWGFSWGRKLGAGTLFFIGLWAVALFSGLRLFSRGIAWREGPCPGSIRA